MRIFNMSFWVAVVICGGAANAEKIVNLDFEQPSTLSPHITSGDYRAYWLLRNADPCEPLRAFDFIIDTPLSNPSGSVQISEGSGINGSRSLDIQINPTAILPDSDRDRFEMRPIHGEGDLALQFGQVRYFGYAVYIDPANPLPVQWAHISQCWQRPTGDLDDTTVNVVPMWMTLINYQGGFGWEIRVKNEGELTGGIYPGQSSSVGTGAFKTGWNTVIMRLAPRHKHDATAANFTVWINETREEFPSAQSSHPWGSTPDAQVPQGLPLTGMTERFDVRCGIYRLKQAVSLHLVFDNIRYGTSFADVLPILFNAPNQWDPASLDSITTELWQMDSLELNDDGSAKILNGMTNDPDNRLTMYAGSVPSKSVGQLVNGPAGNFEKAIWFVENYGQTDAAVPNATARSSTLFLAGQGPYFKAQMWFRPDRLGQHQVLAHARNVTWAISIQGSDLVVTLWFADGTNSGHQTISDISGYLGEWLYVETMFTNKDGGKLEASVKNIDDSFNAYTTADFPGKVLKNGTWLVIGGEEGRRGFYGAIDSLKIANPPDYLPADINRDGYVDIFDLSLLADRWICEYMVGKMCY